MPELNSPLKEKVDDLYLEQAEIKWETKDWNGLLKLLDEAWEILPDTKTKWDESYHIADSYINTFKKQKNFIDAKKWAIILQSCDLERMDDGEREFILGTVYFELNEFDDAKEQFVTAMKKSEGRCFEDQDKKYIDLLKKK